MCPHGPWIGQLAEVGNHDGGRVRSKLLEKPRDLVPVSQRSKLVGNIRRQRRLGNLLNVTSLARGFQVDGCKARPDFGRESRKKGVQDAERARVKHQLFFCLLQNNEVC